MKKVLTSVLAYLFVCCGAMAAPIDNASALKLAGEFFAKHPVKKGASSLKVAYKSAGKSVATAEGNLLYVINRGEDNGYVIVSGDDRVTPILAFADKGTMDEEKMLKNPGVRWILDEYENQIQWAIETAPDRPSQMTARKASAYQIDISPLLEYDNDRRTRLRTPISWGQDWPFNAYAPTIRYTNGRTVKTVAGCVATAIATVMRWHKWPNKATGSASYYWNGNRLSVDWDGPGDANAAYNWAQMPAGVTSAGINRETGARCTDVQANNIGRLLRDVGYAVHMSYGDPATGGSGAFPSDWPAPAVQNFGYSNSIRWLSRNNFTKNNWLQEIRDEMNSYGPVIYAGYSPNGGHCFVLDGFATNGYVHVDWGWNAMENGWYLLDVLEPGAQGIGGGGGGGYSRSQQMIRYMRPNRGNDGGGNGGGGGVNPDPQPNVEDGSNLYVYTKSTQNQVDKANNQYISLRVGNNNRNASFTGQIALAIYKNGETNASVVATTNTTVSANSYKLISFYANLAERSAGSYGMVIAYAKGTKYEVIGEAGNITIVDRNNPEPDPEPDPQPVLKGYDLVVPTTVSMTATKGTSTKVVVNVKNNGDTDYYDYLYLYAMKSGSSLSSATEISSGTATIRKGQSTSITFYTNSTFNTLAAGSYNLVVGHMKDGSRKTVNLNGSTSYVIGQLTIRSTDGGDNPSVGTGDVKLYTAYFYQNNKYLGSDRATISKYNSSSFKVRYYLYSQKGFKGQIRGFITSSSTGTTSVSSSLETTKTVDIAAGKYVDFEVTYPNYYFYNSNYYVKLAAKANGASTWTVGSDYVAFTVSNRYYSYKENENAYDGNAWGPTYIVGEHNDDSQYAHQSVGIEIIFDEDVTGIENVEVEGNAVKEAGTFNLNGQRVGKDYRGVVIENGKKVVRK